MLPEYVRSPLEQSTELFSNTLVKLKNLIMSEIVFFLILQFFYMLLTRFFFTYYQFVIQTLTPTST